MRKGRRCHSCTCSLYTAGTKNFFVFNDGVGGDKGTPVATTIMVGILKGVGSNVGDDVVLVERTNTCVAPSIV